MQRMILATLVAGAAGCASMGLANKPSAGANLEPTQGNAARGTVTRQDRRYIAKINEGGLRDWCLSVDGRTSATLAGGTELAWSA